MGGLISAILSWFFSAFSRLFIVIQSHFLATKIVLVTIFMILFPIILNNIFYEILEIFINKIQSYALSVNVDSSLFRVYQFSGLAGYFISVFKIPESFSVVLSAIAVSFTLRSIPFLRW